MEAEDGNAPFVDNDGVDLAVGVRIGNHFATSGEADTGAVDLPCALLQSGAVTLFFVQEIIELADAGHFATAAKFDVIAAWEISLAVWMPPGDVHVEAADAKE